MAHKHARSLSPDAQEDLHRRVIEAGSKRRSFGPSKASAPTNSNSLSLSATREAVVHLTQNGRHQ